MSENDAPMQRMLMTQRCSRIALTVQGTGLNFNAMEGMVSGGERPHMA